MLCKRGKIIKMYETSAFAQIIHEKNCPEFMFLHENEFPGLLKQQVKLIPFLKLHFKFKSL
jgi:hypothetical protein